LVKRLQDTSLHEFTPSSPTVLEKTVTIYQSKRRDIRNDFCLYIYIYSLVASLLLRPYPTHYCTLQIYSPRMFEAIVTRITYIPRTYFRSPGLLYQRTLQIAHAFQEPRSPRTPAPCRIAKAFTKRWPDITERSEIIYNPSTSEDSFHMTTTARATVQSQL
jgi:hypothetical protein